MNQYSFLQPSLQSAMRFEDKSISQRVCDSLIGSMNPALLSVSNTTTTTASSNTSSSIEDRLVLDLLAAEAALEEYRNANAEELALRALARRRRESFRSALLQGLPTGLMNHLLSSGYPTEPSCLVVPVGNQKESAKAMLHLGDDNNATENRSPSPAAVEAPSQEQSILPQQTEKPCAAALPKQKEPQQEAPTPLPPPPSARRTTQCWDLAISFPSKLLKMLDEAEAEGQADIFSFTPDGKAFMIHKPDEFAQRVLPEYFRTTRLSSFQKQLSLYGFKRIRSGPDRGAIQHEFFQRDNKKLVAKIQRKKNRVPKAEPVYQQLQRGGVWRG